MYHSGKGYKSACIRCWRFVLYRPFRRREKKQRMLKNSWYDRWESFPSRSSNRGHGDGACTSVFQIRERTPYFVFIVLPPLPSLDPLHRFHDTWPCIDKTLDIELVSNFQRRYKEPSSLSLFRRQFISLILFSYTRFSLDKRTISFVNYIKIY